MQRLKIKVKKNMETSEKEYILNVFLSKQHNQSMG